MDVADELLPLDHPARFVAEFVEIGMAGRKLFKYNWCVRRPHCCLVDLAIQAVDGTKVVANASLNRSYDAEGLRGLLERVERAIGDLEAQNEAGEDAAAAHLPEELADKEVLREKVKQAMADLASQERHKRINLTDPDARLMKGRQGIVAGYNAQAMVSPTEPEGGATGMLVTAVDVVDEANDNAMLAPMMERAEETTGTKAQTTLADAGYFAGSHLEECASRGQQVVVSEARQRFLKDPYHKDQFTYDEQSDSFTCPQGQTLAFVRIQHANGSTGLPAPSVRRDYKGQGDWAKSGRRAARRGATSPSAWMATSAANRLRQLDFGNQGAAGGTEVPTARPWRPSGPC